MDMEAMFFSSWSYFIYLGIGIIKITRIYEPKE